MQNLSLIRFKGTFNMSETTEQSKGQPAGALIWTGIAVLALLILGVILYFQFSEHKFYQKSAPAQTRQP